MDEFTKKIFNRILAKDVSALTPSDIIFLRARQAYLTDEQLEKYRMYINLDKEFGQSKEIVEEKKSPFYWDLSMKELYKKAKELGCKTRLGMKRDELIKLIEDCYVL